MPAMSRAIVKVGLIVAAACIGGCVERTITLQTTPPGAVAYLNDVEVGRTPVTVPFKFYGVYDVRLVKDGYETIATSHKADAPWWEAPGPDLFAEMFGGDTHVDLQWHYDMTAAKPADENTLLDHAQQLRATFREDGLSGEAPVKSK
ncbi:MAG: PEGA domain-containing protein [Planctomycetes bacterium]|nr:PEGA domain-containing protein [Planctomycetota bacterium]